MGVLKTSGKASVCLAFLLCCTFAPSGQGRRLLVGPNTAQLSVNATSFRDGDVVQVAWEGVRDATTADAVAMYFAGDNVDATTPLKLKWAFASSKTHLLAGTGNCSFQLINQRRDVVFVLFYNVSRSTGYSSGNLLAKTAPLKLLDPNDPQHIHLALSQTEGTIVAQWTTRDFGAPAVRWGVQSGVVQYQNNGSYSTYTKLQMCGPPANTKGWVDPGALNFAALTGLKPDTRYYYAVGDLVSKVFSREHSFVTGPPIGRQSTVKFLATADLGHAQTDGSTEIDHEQAKDDLNTTPEGTLQYVFEMFYDFLVDNEAQQGASLKTLNGLLASADNATLFLLNGDVSYARGQLTQWDVFMRQMQPLAAQMPWMLIEGNHERDWPRSGDRYTNMAEDSGGECGVPFWQRFFMPTGPIKWVDSQSQRRSPEWYSFDHGPVHFLQMSTEVDFSPGSPQFEYIIQDLSTVNRRRTPWVVVNMHRPIYTSSTAGVAPPSVLRVAEDLQQALEPVFALYQVDLTLSGHDHKYERTCPVYKRNCLPYDANGTAGGPTHVVIGNAGYKLSWAADPTPAPYWMSRALEHGFLRCTVNGTAFGCEEVSSMNGKVLDSFILQKPADWEPDFNVRNLFTSYFISNYSTTDFLESTGIPTQGYSTVYQPIFNTLEQDTRLLQFYLLANNSAALRNCVNGADTVVDAWGAIAPVYNMTVALGNWKNSSIYTKFYAQQALLPIFDMVQQAAKQYPINSGVITARDPNGPVRT